MISFVISAWRFFFLGAFNFASLFYFLLQWETVPLRLFVSSVALYSLFFISRGILGEKKRTVALWVNGSGGILLLAAYGRDMELVITTQILKEDSLLKSANFKQPISSKIYVQGKWPQRMIGKKWYQNKFGCFHRGWIPGSC